MDRDRPSDPDFAAALHEANRILRGEPMRPAAREDIRGKLLQRAMWDRRLNVARTVAAVGVVTARGWYNDKQAWQNAGQPGVTVNYTAGSAPSTVPPK